MSDIVLNGVSIADLKKQKALIQKDAAKFIAEGIQRATSLLDEILKMYGYEGEYDPHAEEDEESEDTGLVDQSRAEQLAQEAVSVLEDVGVVAGVSGVTYYLPYYAEYSDETPYSTRLEESIADVDGEYLWRDKGPLGSLYSVLGDMESDSKLWNTSYC